MLPTCRSQPFTQPSRPFSDPALLLLQPWPTLRSFMKAACLLCVPSAWNPPPASCCPTPTHVPGFDLTLLSSGNWIWASGRNLSFHSPSPPPNTKLSGVLSASLSLSQAPNSSKEARSHSRPQPCAKHRPHLGSAAQSYLSKWITQKQGLKSQVSLIASAQPAPCSSPNSIS